MTEGERQHALPEEKWCKTMWTSGRNGKTTQSFERKTTKGVRQHKLVEEKRFKVFDATCF